MNSSHDTIVVGEAGAAVSGAPLVPWWSFTKTVLAGALLVLVDRGRVDLDAPIAPVDHVSIRRRVEAFASADTLYSETQTDLAYTLRHLLQHTSGLRDYGGVPEYHEAVAAGKAPWSRDELLRRANASDRLFTPGTSWAYSNIGYLFVRESIERAVDRDLDEALQALVFGPLGITDAFVAHTVADMRSTLWGHDNDYDPGWVYHGLVIGSPSAAASVLHGLLHSELLSVELKSEMMKPRSLGGPFSGRPAVNPSYGLGVMIDPISPVGRVVGHTGQGPGSTAAVYSFVDLPVSKTFAAFIADDSEEAQGVVERHVHLMARAYTGAR